MTSKPALLVRENPGGRFNLLKITLKMKRLKSRVIIGIIAVAFILAANLQYAFSEYGILLANTLHINVLAQTSNGSGSSTGTSSSSNSGTSSNSNSGTSSDDKTKCPDYNYVPDRSIVSEVQSFDAMSSSEGEISVSIGGKIETKGGLKKNKSYPVVVEIKNCKEKAPGGCCDQRQVGSNVIIHP